MAVKVLFGIIVVLWCLGPIYWGLVVSLSTPIGLETVPPPLWPHPVTFQFFDQLLNGHSLTSTTFLAAARNSVIEAALTTALTICLTALAAYAFVRLHFAGSYALFLILVGTLSLPVYAVLIPLFQLVSRAGLMNTYTALVTINCTSFVPLALWLLRSQMAAIPVDLENAARVDGAPLLTILGRVVMPLIAPGAASVGILVFLGVWSAFLVPLAFAPTITTEPLTVLVTQYTSRYAVDYGLQAAAGMLAIIPPVVAVSWFNRYLIKGLLTGAVTS